MITDIVDLEQLLAQYGSEVVLVGPLLSLSINASFRYFYFAGNGRKVYQSIGLGFLENESHAQKQRADMIEKLKPRFAELVLFDSHTEMARAVHTRWPTEETARVLAAAETEAKAASAPHLARSWFRSQPLPDQQHGAVAHEFLEHHQSTQRLNQARSSDDASVSEEQRPITLNQGGQLAAEPAATLPLLTKECGEAPARQNQRHLGLTQDNIASAIQKLAAPAQPDNCPISPVRSCRSLPEGPAIFEAKQTLTLSDSVPVLPIKHTRGRSTFLLLAIVLFWTFVLSSTRQAVDKADNTQLAQVNNVPSKSAAAEPPLPTSQPANANGSAQQAEAALTPAAAASRIESRGSNAALVSDPHKRVAQQERTADLSEAKAIAKLVDRGMESLKSGDLESARMSLQRAVEAIPGTATVPSQVEPSRSMPLRGTSRALAVEQPGRQNEHSPQIKSSSDDGQSAQVASLAPGVAPGSGQSAPAQKESAIRHFDPDEIAILLSRGMDLLKSGDFASARVPLRRAAEAGNAKAALALGTTYDPSVLRQLGAIGIAADVAEAREWYGKAFKFGSAAAAQRLARLAQSPR